MTNPLDVVVIDEVRLRSKKHVVPVICAESAFDEALTMFTSKRGKLKELESADGRAARREAPGALDASIIEIVDSVLIDAIGMKASDIHLEPREDVLQIRCRVDGVLHDLREYPSRAAGRRPQPHEDHGQHGHRRTPPAPGRPHQFRDHRRRRRRHAPCLDTQPLRREHHHPHPRSLAAAAHARSHSASPTPAWRASKRPSARPDGGIVIGGPTGSGKSTTLYTTLELIKSKERKIYTVEDPIERKLHGIVQTEVKPIIGLTFAQALRSLVRADPDVIMVGEVRDLETAKMAADAAITGHLVFTTLHTGDAISSINRLIEMGLPRLPGRRRLPLHRLAAAGAPPVPPLQAT